MHPALSVIFFTTLSGTGYGLLAWTALVVLTPATLQPQWQSVLLTALLLALALVTVGLLSSTFHLGKPMRAWRAFSQWRTSWLSREGVAAMLTYVPALVLGALLLLEWLDPTSHVFARRPEPVIVAICLAAALGAIVTVVCTAMIYASLKPIPAWRHGLVVPVYLAFALLGGGLVLAAIASWTGLSERTLAMVAPLAWVLAATTALLKLAYWRAIDRQSPAASRGSAVGLPGREVAVFERPHTEANYITREMGFVLARRHARPLRLVAVLLFVLVPALATGLGWAVPTLAAPLFTLAAVAVLVGAFVERWLFFAQARHAVMAYY